MKVLHGRLVLHSLSGEAGNEGKRRDRKRETSEFIESPIWVPALFSHEVKNLLSGFYMELKGNGKRDYQIK